ncbi:transcriptional regulator [Streptomyces sp. I05A-00742]|uniref:helix-turn-helix transcriptional regulator n=1 Tax=Streptomyces sp. I05A-00742 TaxID=2732853 RepID=UPI001487D14D|nr:PAS domain-containing protein [Streptomyces sp. I05A-00742]
MAPVAASAAPAAPSADDSTADAVLRALRPVVDGLAATFGAQCEVVLHDYRHPDASVVALAGTVTSRTVGGAMSEIGLEMLARGDTAQDKLNYITRTPDGRTVKSSTLLLRDGSGHVFGSLCVNLDITELRLAAKAMAALVGAVDTAPQATTVFSDDIGEIVTAVIEQEEERLGRPLAHDSRQNRLLVIQALDARGVFRLSRAAQVVAERLGVSRATVYADLGLVRGARRAPDGTRPPD